MRDSLHNLVSRRFSSVDLWMVGNEIDLEFFTCAGPRLTADQLVEFAADSITRLGGGIGRSSPDMQTGYSFIGATTSRIRTAEGFIQPLDLFSQVGSRLTEPTKVAFDLTAPELNPGLLEPLSAPASESLSLETASAGFVAGWNLHYIEEFPNDTAEENGSLTADYPNWEDIDTNLAEVEILSTAVSGGLAIMIMQAPPGGKLFSLLGARTVAGEDVVPDELFGENEQICKQTSSLSFDCNRWTAVHDFFAVQRPTDGAHPPIFLRVNPRSWRKNTNSSSQFPDQTRFGLHMRGDIVGQNGVMAVGFQQFTGDDLGCLLDPSCIPIGKTCFEKFDLTADPYLDPDALHRLQVEEKRTLDFFFGRDCLHWLAEIIDLTNDIHLGLNGWISESTLENTFGIATPELNDSSNKDSRLLFGFGPSGDGNGRVDGERVAVSVYIP